MTFYSIYLWFVSIIKVREEQYLGNEKSLCSSENLNCPIDACFRISAAIRVESLGTVSIKHAHLHTHTIIRLQLVATTTVEDRFRLIYHGKRFVHVCVCSPPPLLHADRAIRDLDFLDAVKRHAVRDKRHAVASFRSIDQEIGWRRMRKNAYNVYTRR